MSTQSDFKTYVLLEDTRPSAPIYNVIEKQRIKINAIPKWRPHLQYTFADENNVNVTTRLKLNSNTIFQDKQIKDENIPANAKFSTAERNATKFTNGVLMIRNKVVQEFLEKGCPYFKDFKGTTPEPVKPMFELYDRVAEVKNQNDLTKRTIKVANAIMELELQEAQELLIRINGVGFTPPDDVDEAQNLLIDYMDNSEAAVADLERKLNIGDNKSEKANSKKVTSEDVVAMIGLLVSNGVVSFDAKPNQISKKYGNGWQKIWDISNEQYDFDQRSALLVDFLLSDEGKAMRLSLEQEVAKLNNK